MDPRLALDVTPERAGWRYVGFAVVRLGAGERYERLTGARELCAVVLGGRCQARVGDASWELGGRTSPLDGPPHALYVPPSTTALFTSAEGAEIALCSAPASGGAPARGMGPGEIPTEVRGAGGTQRTIHHILMEDGEAESLLVTEVLTPAGHWSSYPPHKHDTDDPPRETALEETYYHRMRDARGFALQRVYTADGSLDEAITVRDGDLVLVPRGYHTVSAAPGHELYYLNVMAGPVRRWCVTFDPDHDQPRPG
ncbi:5-deoxy-glucuronate isomerase [soil metagenome]